MSGDGVSVSLSPLFVWVYVCFVTVVESLLQFDNPVNLGDYRKSFVTVTCIVIVGRHM